MLAVAHQPTVYVANAQPYYYVQAQSATVPAGQWTTTGQVVAHPHQGSGYVYSTYPTASRPHPVVYQTTQQVARPTAYAVATAPQQMKPAQPVMAYGQPQVLQRSYSSQSAGQLIPSQSSIPVIDPPDFTPGSPVLSEATSDDSTGSSSSSSRYNLPSSAINHYTAPQRERRRSFHQNRVPQAYGVPAAGQSSLSLPPPQVQLQVAPQPLYAAPTASGQPIFVRNTGRSDHPVQYQPGQGQQIYSSFELYKPAGVPVAHAQSHQRPALVRRSSSSATAASKLTSASYGQGLGIGSGGGTLGSSFYGGPSQESSGKWWKLGR